MNPTSDIRNNRSNVSNAPLASMADSPERILCREAGPSFRTAYGKPGHSRQEVSDQVETWDHALESDDEIHHIPPVHGDRPTSAPALPVSNPHTSAELYAAVRQMAREEAERLYECRVEQSMRKATQDALSDRFMAGIDSQKSRIKNSSYVFIETVLTEIVDNESLDDLFKRNVKPWTQSSTFMDAFARRVLTSSRFVCSVAKFIHRSVEHQAEEIKQERTSFDAPLPFP